MTYNLLDIIRVVFIDAVVTKMHARIPQVLIGLIVLDCCEPHQALLVEVY